MIKYLRHYVSWLSCNNSSFNHFILLVQPTPGSSSSTMFYYLTTGTNRKKDCFQLGVSLHVGVFIIHHAFTFLNLQLCWLRLYFTFYSSIYSVCKYMIFNLEFDQFNSDHVLVCFRFLASLRFLDSRAGSSRSDAKPKVLLRTMIYFSIFK